MIKNFISKEFIDTNYTCIICLDEINCKNYMIPAHCKCQIKIHTNCFNKVINNMGLLCPICRIKPNSNNLSNNLSNTQSNNLSNTQSNDLTIIRPNNELLFEIPIYLYMHYPNLLTFIIWIVLSFLIFISYILPLLLYCGLKNPIYRYKILKSIACLFLYFLYICLT